MDQKQLIIVIEGTAALGAYWNTILSDYLEKIVRAFAGTDSTGQKTATSNIDFNLVSFSTTESYCGCLVRRSPWTKNVDLFLDWLSAFPFSGGGFSNAAIAEGLSEALMMFSIIPNGGQNQQKVDLQRHCILVAASNPNPLPSPVYRPQIQDSEQGENNEAQPESRLFDAEAIAKSFPQCSVSLSVICPKQLPKLRDIYNAGKQNPQSPDPPIDSAKSPHSLVLISECFMEARAALGRPGVTNLAQNASPVKMDVAPVTSAAGPPPTSVPPVNGSMMNWQTASAGNVPTATIKAEPTTVTSTVSGPAFPHIPSNPRASSQAIPSLQASSPPTTSQEMVAGINNVQEVKPSVSGMTQPSRPVPPAAANVNILNNLSQARVINSAALAGGTSMGLQSMGQTSVAMHMSNMISSGMSSSVPATQNAFSSGQSGMNSNTGSGGVNMGQPVPGMSQGNHPGGQMVQNGMGMNQNMPSGLGPSGVSSGTGTMMSTQGMPQQMQSGVQSLGMNNGTAANMPLAQQTSNAMQPAQSKYIKIWEGNLSGQRQGQPVFITRLEAYRSASASETLAANWPPIMQIVRLISADHMNNKEYVGKADFLVFRAMTQHGFLGQLQEKKLCAVIQLASQTLLLSTSDKACRLIGMLFPGDMVVFRPQVSNHQKQQQQQQQLLPQQLQSQQQQQQQQQHPQMQQQPQLPQLQQQHFQQQQQQQQQLPQMQQQQQQQQQLPQMQQQQQMPTQQQQQQLPQMQQQQMPQQQQFSQMQQQPQLPQQQQMVGSGMNSTYAQGPGRHN